MRRIRILVAVLIASAVPAAAELASAWVVPAAAHNPGDRDTYWRTDLSLHNPHQFWLPVVVHFLPSDTVNHEAMALDVELGPWQSVNLWDVLGPDGFDADDTGALLVYTDLSADCSSPASCDFLATSRTYTLDGGDGEYGQVVPGRSVFQGTDWWTFAYAAGILNDGADFRCNVGLMSWTDTWVEVAVDVQDDVGNVIATHVYEVPPFGHLQRRLPTEVMGGSLVFYVADGPDDTLVFPYASVVNQRTGDPSFFAALPSEVGPVEPKARPLPTRPALPEVSHRLRWTPQDR